MALPRTLSLGPLVAADDDGVAQAQTPSGAGNLTINGALSSGGAVTFDVPRRVLVTTAADEHTKVMVIYGTDRYGQAITESPTLPSSATTVATKQDFKTISRVSIGAATSGALKVGTNAVASSEWSLLNRNAQPFNVGIAVEVTGTVNYTIQTTYDDIMGSYDSSSTNAIWTAPAVPVTFDDPVGGSTASDEFQLLTPVLAVRVTLNSGTGSVKAKVIQAGIIG